mmetsp:Transcript_14471/g.48467  ORF Transcript_14471/g.48467 Transcript_14471/m.48467 type:complete len:355 (-) Transcript_14471:490-1554(-)
MVVLAASSTSRPTVPHNGVGPMCPRLNDGSKPRSGAGAGPDDPVWSRARTSSAPCSVSAARARLRLPTRSASSSTCRTSVARPVARSKAATSRRASISADACVASALEMSSPVCGGEGSAPPLPWSPSASNCTPHFKSGSKRVSVRAHARNSGGMQSGGRLFTWTTSKSAPTTQTHEWPMLTMSPAATCARTPATDADVPLVRPAVDLARAALDADALPKRGVPKHNWKYLGRGSRKRLDDRPVLRPHLHVVPLLERRRVHAFKNAKVGSPTRFAVRLMPSTNGFASASSSRSSASARSSYASAFWRRSPGAPIKCASKLRFKSGESLIVHDTRSTPSSHTSFFAFCSSSSSPR